MDEKEEAGFDGNHDGDTKGAVLSEGNGALIAMETVKSRSRKTAFFKYFKEYREEFVLTQNGKILLVSIVLFGSITAAQFAAAFIANSLALLADCGSMLADVITYVFNFLAECRPNRSHVKGKLIASLLSLIVLVGIALWAVNDAIVSLIDEAKLGDDSGSGDVNPKIVLGFGIVGLVFDFIAIAAFFVPDRLWRRTAVDERNEMVSLSSDEMDEEYSSGSGRASPEPPATSPMSSPSEASIAAYVPWP